MSLFHKGLLGDSVLATPTSGLSFMSQQIVISFKMPLFGSSELSVFNGKREQIILIFKQIHNEEHPTQ